METTIKWVLCKDELPEIGDTYFVIVKEEDFFKKGVYYYHIDMANSFGDYIDDFWDTCNDWCEGQEVHIIAWAEANIDDKIIDYINKTN